MKKLLLLLAFAFAFTLTACNDDEHKGPVTLISSTWTSETVILNRVERWTLHFSNSKNFTIEITDKNGALVDTIDGDYMYDREHSNLMLSDTSGATMSGKVSRDQIVFHVDGNTTVFTKR